MSLVNLDGTSIFGAGSEWFWSMAQFLLVAASILGIYVQLRVQRASSLSEATDALLRDWNEELFMTYRLAALIDLEGRPVESGLPSSTTIVCDFFERIGYLVAQKHLRAADVWHSFRAPVGGWWTRLEPYLERTRLDEPRVYEWFERLEMDLRRLDRKAFGSDFKFAIAISLREGADDLTRQLQLVADARNGRYPTMPPEPVLDAEV